MDQIWIQLKLCYNEDLLEVAIDRAKQLEQLLRLVLRYEEAVNKGFDIQFVRRALFKAARDLSNPNI